jgi:hypothetical protein
MKVPLSALRLDVQGSLSSLAASKGGGEWGSDGGDGEEGHGESARPPLKVQLETLSAAMDKYEVLSFFGWGCIFVIESRSRFRRRPWSQPPPPLTQPPPPLTPPSTLVAAPAPSYSAVDLGRSRGTALSGLALPGSSPRPASSPATWGPSTWSKPCSPRSRTALNVIAATKLGRKGHRWACRILMSQCGLYWGIGA